MRECGKSEPPKYIETIVPVEVSVPAITSAFPEVKDPVPVSTITETEIDSTYYFKWLALKNKPNSKDSLFKEVIKINTYKETVEDDTLSIDLEFKVRGEMLSYKIDYTINPQTVKTEIPVKIEIPRPPMIYFGADLVMANGNAEMSSSLAPGILFIPKNHKYAVKGNYDLANESFLLGAYYKF